MLPRHTQVDEVTDLIHRSGVSGTVPKTHQLDFKDLMNFRINNILLVSSLYDYYTLVEDGQLTEAIFNEYSELNLHYAPHTRVEREIDVALSNSFGFGGHNVTLALGRYRA